MRIIVAGVLGGIVMFIFTSIAHVATPAGQVGVGQVSDERPMLSALAETFGQRSGLYLYPAYDTNAKNAMATYGAKLATSPNGLLVYHPPGGHGMQASQFATEFLTELVESLIAAIVVAHLTFTAYLSRLGIAALIGVAGAITTNVSYWNWYGFPTNYTIAYSLIEIGGYVAAGSVIAAILRDRP